MPPTESTRCRGGQLDAHAPSTRKGIALVGLQLRHCEGPSASHVWQSASHTSHVALTLAYFPRGVHDVMQLSPSRAGVAPEHEVQRPSMLQVRQLRCASIEAHGWHDDFPASAPHVQAKPTSLVQLDEQPSPDTRLPSSHASSDAHIPSPHTLTHTSVAVSEPPVQTKPGSGWHVGEQPSPATWLPSSHPSPPHATLLPSPQIGEQLLSVPMPEPHRSASVQLSARVQLHPTSSWHSASQPSSGSVLLSSHASALDRRPLPQTWTTGVSFTGATSLAFASSVSVGSPTPSSIASSRGELASSSSTTVRPKASTDSRRLLTASARAVSGGCGPRCIGG